LWQRHWAGQGQVTSLQLKEFELAVLAKHDFSSSQLLVAESEPRPDANATPDANSAPGAWRPTPEDVVQGFVLLSKATRSSPSAIAAVCVNPDAEDPLSVAKALIDGVANHRDSGAPDNAGTIALTRQGQIDSGLMGMPPIAGPVGVPDFDRRTSGLLTDLGFKKSRRWQQMSLQMQHYRPPLDRAVRSLQRGCRMAMQSTVVPQDVPPASIAHLDCDRFVLIASGRKAPTARIDVLVSDREAMVMPPDTAILHAWQVNLQETPTGRGARGGAASTLPTDESVPLRVLVSESIFSLQRLGVKRLEAVFDASDAQTMAVFEQMNFQATMAGNDWQRDA
ncbi:MAG: hypothetical protein AAFP90_15895, partial [Planctomycetota bacterium]